MKKVIFCLIILHLAVTPVLSQTRVSSPSGEQESSPTAKPTTALNPLEEKILGLKERIATKVAQLKLLKKKILIGKISTINESLLTLATKDGDRRVETDEDTTITQIAGDKRRNINFSELKKDQSVVVSGNYIQEGDILTAKAIFAKETPIVILGKVEGVSIKEGTITLTRSVDNQTIVFDIEIFTKINTVDKTNKITKIGLSKIPVGNTTLVVTTTTTKGEVITYTANRILVFPQLVPSPPTPSPTIYPTASPSATPTKSKVPTPTM